MGNYDSEVRIRTKVDTSQMQQLRIQVDKTVIKAEHLQKELDELKNKKVPTQEFTKLQDELGKCQKELNKLVEKETALEYSGITFGRKWEVIIAQEAEAGIRIDSIKEKMQQLEQTGKAFTIGANPDEINKKTHELSLAHAELSRLVTKQEELGEKNNTISKGFKKVGDIGKRVFSGMNGHAKKSNGLFSTFASRLKGIALSLLIFNWISKSFNSMITGMEEGSKNLVKYSAEYNKSMSDLKSANTQLKNSFATAFAPIAQAAIPHLIALMNYITSAMNKVAQFVAVLSGKSSWLKAIAVQEDYADSLNGTAAAAKKAMGALASFDTLEVLDKKDSASGSGSGLNPDDMFEEIPVEDLGAVNFAQRLKELILNDDWYGVGSALGKKLNEAMENISWERIKTKARKIAVKIANFLNGGIETIDWHLTGVTLAQGLNTALEFLYSFATTFHWDGLGLAIANGINGFFDTFDFALAAKNLNKWVDGLKEAIKTALTNTQWDDIWDGVKIFLSNLEIDTVAVLVGAVLIKKIAKVGLLNSAKNLLAAEIIKSLGTITIPEIIISLTNFSVSPIGVGTAGFDVIAFEILSNLDEALSELIPDFISNFIGDFIAGFALVGAVSGGNPLAAIIGGLLFPVKENLVGLFDPSIALWWFDEAKKAFQTAFDGKRHDFWDIGLWIVEGIVDGIIGALSLVATPFLNLFEWIRQGICDVFGIASPAKEMRPLGQYILLGIIEGFGSMLPAFGETMQKWWEEYIIPWFTLETWTELAQGIMDGISIKWDELKEWWGTSIGDWWDNSVAPWFTAEKWKELGNNMKRGIYNGFVGVVNKVVDVVNSIIGACESMINYIINKINRLIESCAEWGNKIPGVNLPTSGIPNIQFDRVKYPSIPALADGAVIRGGNPFMAILGDQRLGQTNIEAPQSAIEDAVAAGMSRAGFLNSGSITVNLNYDGETFARLSLDDILSEMDRRGYDVDILGGFT